MFILTPFKSKISAGIDIGSFSADTANTTNGRYRYLTTSLAYSKVYSDFCQSSSDS